MRISASSTLALRRRTRREGRGLWAVAVLGLVAVLLQVTILPYAQILDGIPDLVAALVAAVGLLRGPLVGAVTGFCAGLLVELASPGNTTLGVLALLYLALGAFAGRFTERPEATGLLLTLMLVVGGAGFVQVGLWAVEALRGDTLPFGQLVGRVLVPQMLLTALLAPPVLLSARRLLGAPRVIEPFVVPPQ